MSYCRTDAILMAIAEWRTRVGDEPPPVLYGIVRRAFEMGRESPVSGGAAPA